MPDRSFFRHGRKHDLYYTIAQGASCYSQPVGQGTQDSVWFLLRSGFKATEGLSLPRRIKGSSSLVLSLSPAVLPVHYMHVTCARVTILRILRPEAEGGRDDVTGEWCVVARSSAWRWVGFDRLPYSSQLDIARAQQARV